MAVVRELALQLYRTSLQHSMWAGGWGLLGLGWGLLGVGLGDWGFGVWRRGDRERPILSCEVAKILKTLANCN